MKYWQVAAGEDGRDYSEDFLNFGVMFIGNLPADLVRFAERAQKDDVVVLKKPNRGKTLKCGRWQIVAVGLIAGCSTYRQQFDDVQGWDLRNCRRVEW